MSTACVRRDRNNLILANLERGTHAMTLVGGGFVATSDQALLCAFAMHPFDHNPGVRRRLVRRVWRRARLHGQASRYATGTELVQLAASAVRDYYLLAQERREHQYMERCVGVLSAALFNGNSSATMRYLTTDQSQVSVPSPGAPKIAGMRLLST